MGFTLGQESSLIDTSSLWADYWKIEDLDSKTSKEFYDKASKPTIGSGNEKDGDPGLPPLIPIHKQARIPWPLDQGVPHEDIYEYPRAYTPKHLRKEKKPEFE